MKDEHVRRFMIFKDNGVGTVIGPELLKSELDRGRGWFRSFQKHTVGDIFDHKFSSF